VTSRDNDPVEESLYEIITRMTPGRPEVEAFRAIVVASRHYETDVNLVEAVDVHTEKLDREQLLRLIDYLAKAVASAFTHLDNAREV
jgi:hypothetical protein